MRRWVRWLVAVAGLAGALFVILAVAPRPRTERISKASFDRLREGMSLVEVADILGPPGDHRTGPTTSNGPDYIQFRPDGKLRNIYGWITDSADISVSFDNSGLVEWKSFRENSRRADTTVLVELLARVKSLWQRWFPG